jgi:hypothetical protein
MKLESLHRVLEEILNSPMFAIQSSEYFATRTDSLATGKTGLELAIHEYKRVSDESCEQIKFDSIQNVFSSCFENNGAAVLTEPAIQEPQSPEMLGDIFNGYASEVWSNAVLNLTQIDKHYEDKPGEVIRPGLGHGELSRDLTKWIVTREPKTFFPQLDEGLGIGWCNGRSGLLSALGVYYAYSNDPDALDSMDNLLDELFLETLSCLQSLEYGLCHGISGSFVSMAGAARLTGKKDFLESLRIAYGDWLKKLNYTLIPPQLFLDNSWLTGSSGVLWGYAVLEKTPEFNPIFPPDSERWSK